MKPWFKTLPTPPEAKARGDGNPPDRFFLLLTAAIAISLVVPPSVWVLASYFQSRAYNRITGAHTTITSGWPSLGGSLSFHFARIVVIWLAWIEHGDQPTSHPKYVVV